MSGNPKSHRYFSASVVNYITTLVLLTAVLSAASAKTIAIGNPAHPGSLSREVATAYASGADHIVIRAGSYILPVVDAPNFNLNGWHDVVVNAYGASFMITNLDYGHRCFQLTNCKNVTIEGALISQVSQVMYQGKIVSTAMDTNGNETCIWKPDAGYPVFPADAKTFTYPCEEVDQHTRLLKIGLEGFNYPPIINLGDGTFQISFGKPNVGIVVGDWLCGRGPGHDSFKVYLENCRNCTVKDITMYRNGFSAIRESSGGGNHLIGDKWLPGPPPDGGTEPPLFCASADGFHSTLTNPGPDVENCEMHGLLDDDCIAIHGNYTDVLSSSGSTFTVANHNEYGYSGLAANQPVRIDNASFYAEANIASVKNNGDGTSTFTMNRAINLPSKVYAFNPLACGAGYKVINCNIGNTRSRGLLTKADNGIIRGNTIRDCGDAAMQLGSDWWTGEAGYSNNVLVENNTILGNGGQTGGGMAAIHIGTSGLPENHHWIVRNNVVKHFTGLGMEAIGCDGMTVYGNKFIDPIVTSNSKGRIIAVVDSKNIKFGKNTVIGLTAPDSVPHWSVDTVSTNISGLDELSFQP